VPDRLCFRGIIIRLVTGASWVDIEAILEHRVSDTTLRARRDEWIDAGVFESLKTEALAAFDRIIGLDLDHVALDGSLHKAPYGGGRQPDHHAGLLGVGEHGRARDEPPDVTARHRVGDDADRDVGHQPVAAHPPAVGVLLTHRPPCPPSRVPSPGYAFPQPLRRVTIVI
jgi:hypothetical protein